MKLDIRNAENKVAGSIDLPRQFDEPVREDLIKRAVLALQANRRQRYGAYSEAGKRPSVRISKRRHDFRGTYGIGQSRTPRKAMSARGTRFHWEGAFAPQTVGGRRAHAPKASKIWTLKINTKERIKAIACALAASISKAYTQERGHIIPDSYPFAVTNDFENMAKTSEVITALEKLGFADELARADVKKIRAGKGKMRGRTYKTRTSILFVTSNECALSKSAGNIPGVTTVTAKELNAEMLAPGTTPGRVTLYTEDAIKFLATPKKSSDDQNAAVNTPNKEKKAPVKKVAKKVEVKTE